MIEPKNIVIIRTDRIGDVVLSLPMIDILKKNFPESRITFALRQYTKVLIDGNPAVNEVIVLHEKNKIISFWRNLSILRLKNFHSAILVSPTFKTALLLFLTGIKYRVGTGYRWYSLLFNMRIFEHRKYGDKHELQLNVNLLKAFGINEIVKESDVHFNIHIDENSKQKVDGILKSLNINVNNPIIIIHPGSGGSSINLPFSKMKELAGLLAQVLAYNILLTGSAEEKKLCEEMITNKNTYNLAGLFDLKELIALIDRSELMIANSTGPIHIAAALVKHVIGFYPKIASCSQNRWGPFTVNKNIFSPAIDCSNCSREQCENLNCMNSIDIQQVFSSIQKALLK